MLLGGLRIKKTASPYSQSQIFQWLNVIGYSSNLGSLHDFPVDIDTLTMLTQLHTVSFPFENTQMHYTAEHIVQTEPEALFQRFVIERKGSWCFGQNTLLLGMLRGLGYRAYAVAARCDRFYNPKATSVYSSLTHQLLLVQPSLDDKTTYIVDVGYGGPGLTRPILLSDSPDNMVMGATLTQWHRVTRGVREDSSLESGQGNLGSHVEWHLEMLKHKTPTEEPSWQILYIFAENEFYPVDIAAGSFYESMKIGRFMSTILCTKIFVLDEEQRNMVAQQINDFPKSSIQRTATLSDATKMFGRLTLFGTKITKIIGTSTELVATLETEEERRIVLKDIFDINIDVESLTHIVGRPAEILATHKGD
ncbi:hypothetical protein C8J56DRAFT_937321 [Mycena floridula]|nr:hypothetical protein C8J56DRAFT_937321 [Mycena floridula]